MGALTTSLVTSGGTGVDVVGLEDLPRDELVDVFSGAVGVAFSSRISSLDGVDARESPSLLPVLEPSGFFGFAAAAVGQRNEKKNLIHLLTYQCKEK